MDGVSSARIRALAHESEQSDTQLGREVGSAGERCFAPIRVQVAGRTGVGKSAVRAVLSRRREFAGDDIAIVEAASIDVPRTPDPILDGDVVVHVLAGGAHPSDMEAIASARAPATGTAAGVVVVLAKADTIDHLDSVVERTSASVGTAVHPLMSTIAMSVMRGRPVGFDALRPTARAVTPEMLATPERFFEADLPMPQDERRVLVDAIETYGIAIVARALVDNPATDDATLRLLLAERSGADAVARAVSDAVEGVRVDRQGGLLHRLTELAVLHPDASGAIEQYLATDEAVVAVMRSGLRALGESEVDSPTHRTVQLWHRRFRLSTDPAAARAALAVARGYMRVASR